MKLRSLLRKPTRKDLPMLWDGLMVYLALLNVGLILFDWTWEWLRPFYSERAPWLVELYAPWHERFWLLDLPFLTLFATELLVRWIRAIRRNTYRHWFIFPLVNWFDLLGIVPLTGFRFFRLFRLVSIYVRLHRSELTSVGRDPLSRSASFLADVVTEEISDRVAVRILTLAQEEVRSGVMPRILRQVLVPRRDEVREKITAKVSEIVADPELKERARKFLKVNLERSLDEAAVLRAVPLPKALLQPLVQVIGQAVYLSILQTLKGTLGSEEGQEALAELVDAVMDTFQEEIGRGEIEGLLEEALVDALEEMKTSVGIQRWAVAEREAEHPEG